MRELYTLSVRELAAGVRDQRWSAAQVVRSHVERIRSLDSRVQAWEHLDLDRAIAQAEAADRATVRGPLQGVPVAIKDIIDVRGMPTRCGSPIHAQGDAARESAVCVSALERAGAIVLGKSVTTEFAYYTPGKTRNPWNPAHTPGGSSMGSAASVACGMAAGALGTQTNGSVIRPAAFCGIVGFKPSFGSVSNHGTLDPWPSLDHTGVFARDVADVALLASVIVERNAVSAHAGVLTRMPKLALVRSPVWHLALPAQRESFESSATTLRRAGASVEALDLPEVFNDAHAVHRVILAYEGARYFEALQKSHRDMMSPRFNELIDAGLSTSAAAYERALQSAVTLRAEFARSVQPYDCVVTPPTTGEAPPTLDETGNPSFCTVWTLLGVPAVTIPSGSGPAGLPLGLQIIGRHNEDDLTLATAAWCESQFSLSGFRLQ